MKKKEICDYMFLSNMAMLFENGENIERALFSSNEITKEQLFNLQLGEKASEIISSMNFHYPALTTLFYSIENSEVVDVLQRLKTISKLIEKRENAVQEKQIIMNIHKRRIKIMRYTTLITIAVIAGFSPVFANLYSFLSTGNVFYQSSFISILSISFLLINMLNNYFLMKLANETRFLFRLSVVFCLHVAIAFSFSIFIRIFLS
ncbi:MAG: hypothetical protein ACTSSG_04455 [Candidatus Heimdallarchaeaceae archaeon]